MKRLLPLFTIVCLLNFSGAYAQIIDSVLVAQYFQGTGIPAEWHQTTLASDSGWKFGINTQLQSTYFMPPAHTKFACTNDDSCNCNKSSDRLITDTFDFSGQSSVVLQFAYYFLGISESATVEVSLDGGANWQVAEGLTAVNTWTTHKTDLSIFAAGQPNVLVAFKYNDQGTFGYGLAIDDVVIFRPSGKDGALSQIIPAPGSYQSYALVGDSITLAGIITNYTGSRIANFPVKWSDGVNTWSYTLPILFPLPLRVHSFIARNME